MTAGGKPLKDSLEAIGHAKAYDFMLRIAREKPFPISESVILELHRLFYEGIDKQNAGKYREISVYITETDYLPPEPEKVPEQQVDIHPFVAECTIETQKNYCRLLRIKPNQVD